MYKNKFFKMLLIIVLLQFIGGSFLTASAAPQAQSPDEGLAPLLVADNVEIVPNQYIVVLKSDFSAAATSTAIQSAIESVGGSILHFYDAVLNGYSAIIPPEALEWVRSDPAVAYVEADSMAYPTQEDVTTEWDASIEATQNNPTWGINRVDQRNLPLNTTYIYDNTAPSVHAYVIDTGILKTHTQFGSRVKTGVTYVYDGRGTSDCNGHGTHVSGTIAGTTYGIAKAALLYPVRVFGCTGGADWSTIIAGVNWVANNHIKPAVVNMSLGGGANTSIDAAVNALINKGVTVVVAAGNDNINACNASPARVPNAITVGATTSTDARSSFSNWGSCLDIFAPGSSITSAYYTSNTATATMSGTSMASPHVAGAAALYLQTNKTANAATVTSYLKNISTLGKVTAAGTGSPNKLLYTRLFIPTPLTPKGTITDTTPTYKWSKAPGATQYRYQLYQGTTLKYTKTVGSSACGALTCSHTPTNVLPKASYKWRVQAYIGGAWKTYSAYKYFQFSTTSSGFTSWFTSDAAGWSRIKGWWTIVSPGYYRTNGIYGTGSSVVHTGLYPKLTYEVKMKRTGDLNGANRIMFRGTPYPLGSTNWWYSGYVFQYTNAEQYSIYKVVNGTTINLVPWTTFSGINAYAFNTLKITAEGTYLKFYINGSLVAYGTDTSISTGKVGIGMYKGVNVWAPLMVDWAKVSTTVTAGADDFAGAVELQENILIDFDPDRSPTP